MYARPDPNALTLTTRSPHETERLGERLGKHLQSGDIVCLSGELGSGKTCFTRGLARGWGAVERPTSPTFTLINEYHRPGDALRLFHMDCYRLADADEAWTTGMEDVLDASGVLVIEWPERIAALLPPGRLWVVFRDMGEQTREIIFSAEGDRAVSLLAAITQGQGAPWPCTHTFMT